jgi:hypothetical protein
LQADGAGPVAEVVGVPLVLLWLWRGHGHRARTGPALPGWVSA